jgi:hypothetical protein
MTYGFLLSLPDVALCSPGYDLSPLRCCGPVSYLRDTSGRVLNHPPFEDRTLAAEAFSSFVPFLQQVEFHAQTPGTELQLLARRDHTLALVICPYLHFEHFTSAASEDYFLCGQPSNYHYGDGGHFHRGTPSLSL